MVSKATALALALIFTAGCMPALKVQMADVEARLILNEVIAQSNRNEAALEKCCPQEVEDASKAD